MIKTTSHCPELYVGNRFRGLHQVLDAQFLEALTNGSAWNVEEHKKPHQKLLKGQEFQPVEKDNPEAVQKHQRAGTSKKN